MNNKLMVPLQGVEPHGGKETVTQLTVIILTWLTLSEGLLCASYVEYFLTLLNSHDHLWR